MAEAARLTSALWQSLRGDAASLGSSRPAANKADDLAVFAVFTALIFVANWAIRLGLVAPLAARALRSPQGPAPAAKVLKFAQSAMEAWIYGAFSVIGLLIVPSQPWVWPSANWWIGFADEGAPHAVMRDDLRCYYLLYAARYFQGFVTTLLEPKRKDFAEMLIHHSVTVAVCAISYWYGWNRVGVVVMVILDPADVPLHLAKLCKYTAEAREGRAAKRWTFAADRLFELFAAMFFAMRLVLYPYVCWSAHIEATAYFPKYAAEWSCVALLEILLALQVYWFFLIVKVAVRMMATGSAEDVRSDSEEEEKPKPPSPLRQRAERVMAALAEPPIMAEHDQLTFEAELKKDR